LSQHKIGPSIALIAPNVRMVFVVAYGDRDEPYESDIFPVVAIQAIESEGDINHDAVICDDGFYGLISTTEFLRDWKYTASQIVVCDWPAQDDTKRLADTIAYLKRNADLLFCEKNNTKASHA